MVSAEEIVASVLVPCWNVAPWLDAALDSMLAAADRLACGAAEIICVDDGSTDDTPVRLAARAGTDTRIRVITQTNRGLSGARNAALRVARGRYVFCVDPDDTVDPDFLRSGVEIMEKEGADWCVFPYRLRDGDAAEFRDIALKGDYRYADNADVLRGFVSRIIGYSFADVRRWFAGEDLFAPREFGSVCRCVYRRELIERHQVRFDESIHLWEDALFNCEYLLYVKHTAVGNRALYDYTARPSGLMNRLKTSVTGMENKLHTLRARRRLDELSAGRLTPFYSGSCVFAPLEILARCFHAGLGPWKACRIVRDYLADPVAKKAVRTCPLSWRKPLFSFAVVVLRIVFCR